MFAVVAFALPLLAGCATTGDVDPSGGITAVRTVCPVVEVPAGLGDVTLFDPADARTESALDVTATITNVRSTCDDKDAQVMTHVTFTILASRRDAQAARDVTLPYFVTVVRGGTSVIAKRIANATVHFDAGQARVQVQAGGTTSITRSAATLPDNVRRDILKPRKAGEEAAAVDPLADPKVRDAVRSATFEALVGFQLSEDQLKYNMTR